MNASLNVEFYPTIVFLFFVNKIGTSDVINDSYVFQGPTPHSLFPVVFQTIFSLDIYDFHIYYLLLTLTWLILLKQVLNLGSKTDHSRTRCRMNVFPLVKSKSGCWSHPQIVCSPLGKLPSCFSIIPLCKIMLQNMQGFV